MMSGTQGNPIVISDDDDDEISREIVQKDSEEIITVATPDSTTSFDDTHMIDIACICIGILHVLGFLLGKICHIEDK